MNKNVERGRATRAHVVEVATRLFAEHGYDGTSIEAVQASAGVSRGSLYHHFPGKEALFWAVLEEVGARITQQGEAIARDAPDPVAMLRAGALAWIRLAGDPVVRQIMLIEDRKSTRLNSSHVEISYAVFCLKKKKKRQKKIQIIERQS